jgi:ADP-ribosyl-[dinitrogen reductase] hydrolase
MSAQPALKHPAPQSVLPNSYWVVPGRLLAGEHPGAHTLSDTTDRLQALLFAGVTLFVDLSEEGEAPSYSQLLMYAAGAVPINHVRHAFSDHAVPESPQAMQDILDAIDLHLAQQGVVYVHCRSGIGRTATVIGCYLVRLGMGGDEALERLNEVWSESERSHTTPRVPKTQVQIEYIRNWQSVDPRFNAQQSQKSAKLDRYTGALLGMAIGEALGALVTVDPHAVALVPSSVPSKDAQLVRDLAKGGPRNLQTGAWLSNTAMCWALAESLLECKGHNPDDQMQRYLDWQRNGKYASTDVPVEVPEDVNKALAQWQWSHKPNAGSTHPEHRDAHALARTLAIAMYFSESSGRSMLEAAESARTTLQSPIVLDANRAFVTLLLDAFQGVDKDSLLSVKKSANAEILRGSKLQRPVLQTIDGWWRGPVPPARVGSDVIAVLNTALWAFAHSDDFREGVVLAANLSGNPTCSGAVFGALAGAFYGVRRIPQEWRNAVLKAQPLSELAARLAMRE